jgi:hypothetical protein
MNLDIHYSEEYKDYSIFWSQDDELHNSEIKNWCNQTFGNLWENGIEDLHYIRLTSAKDATMFILRWS